MDRSNIESSNLVGVGYDPDTLVLEVEFKNGAVYQYDQVPKEIFDALMEADSHGSYFIKNVKNSFKYTRMEDQNKPTTL